MTETTRNTLVGLFVLVSLTVLGLMMVWFGETPSWLGRNEWTLRITGVAGLSGVGDGSPVNLNGVEIGRVRTLEFQDPQRPAQGVIVVARIKQAYYVPRGARARVYGATLGLGMGHVDILVERDQVRDALPKDGSASISGEMRDIIRELISQDLVDSVERTITHIGDLAKAAEPVATDLAELLESRPVEAVARPEGPTPNLATVVERLDNLVENLNAVLGDVNVQEEVKAAVTDVKDAAEEFKNTIALLKSEIQRTGDNVNAGIDGADRNLEKSLVRLYEMLEKLDSAAASLAGVMRDVAAGKGTVGLLARDERLYESAVLTFDRLSELIGTLQRIADKIEEEGRFNIGKVTPVGVFEKSFPIETSPRSAP